MLTLDKTNLESLTSNQIEAIKKQAQEIWGDKWLAKIVREYARLTETNERYKYAQIQRYFKHEAVPNLDTMNFLLLAVNCKFQMVCYSERVIN